MTTIPAIACAAAVVLAGAWALGPNLPGADGEPLFETRNDRGGVTEIVSPLVDIRSRLVNQAENELFIVRADLPSYWRAAALPEFDGDQWSLPDTILDEVERPGQRPVRRVRPQRADRSRSSASKAPSSRPPPSRSRPRDRDSASTR